MAQCSASDLIAQACQSGFTCRSEPELLALLNQLLCNLSGQSSEALVYRAILDSDGSNAPTVTVLESSFTTNPVWSRALQGIYNCTLTGGFPSGKTFFVSGNSSNSGNVPEANTQFIYVDTNTLQLYAMTSAVLEDQLYRTSVEILVYP